MSDPKVEEIRTLRKGSVEHWSRPDSHSAYRHLPKPWEAPSPEVDAREARRGAAFDRWLAAHDEEVARKALTDAADWLDLDPASALWDMWNVERAEYSTPTDALRARAEQIGENRG